MELLVAGSRNYYDYEEFSDIMNFIHKKYNITEIVSGGAHGADSLAERWSKKNDISIKIFKADWNMYGKSAGFIRNTEMHNYFS